MGEIHLADLDAEQQLVGLRPVPAPGYRHHGLATDGVLQEVVMSRFPSDIQGCMKDCVLNLFWPRKDIIKFLEDHGCTPKVVGRASDWKEHQLRRVDIVDEVFANLNSRKDGGLGAFRAMLQALLNWSHFDPYWFDTKKKLNRETANRALNHLRQLQEIRDAKVQRDRERREARERETQRPRKLREALRTEFLQLHSGALPPQRRGYALEKILLDLARLAGLEVVEPFRVQGEQIDGAFKYEGENYLLEAKWHRKELGNEAVYQFVGKVEGKMYGRGVFVSVQGFTDNVVRSIAMGKALKTVFVDAEDLLVVLDGQLDFGSLVGKKVAAAQTRGEVYVHPILGISKL